MTHIDKAEALARCPFCGETLFTKAADSRSDLLSVHHPLSDCLLSGDSWWLVPKFTAAWNRRAALPAREVGVKQLQWKQAGGDIKEGEGFSAWPDLIHTPVTIYRKRDGWWLNLDCKTHPTLEAAKAAAQADYEARILSALIIGDENA